MHSEELIFGEKFALQNRLDELIVGRQIRIKIMYYQTFFALFRFEFEGNLQV